MIAFNRPTNRQQAGYGVNDFYLRYEGSASLTGANNLTGTG